MSHDKDETQPAFYARSRHCEVKFEEGVHRGISQGPFPPRGPCTLNSEGGMSACVRASRLVCGVNHGTFPDLWGVQVFISNIGLSSNLTQQSLTAPLACPEKKKKVNTKKYLPSTQCKNLLSQFFTFTCLLKWQKGKDKVYLCVFLFLHLFLNLFFMHSFLLFMYSLKKKLSYNYIVQSYRVTARKVGVLCF